MAQDDVQELLDLFSDNWNGANTDGATAAFRKITDARVHNFNDNPDLVCAHRPMVVQKPAGLGTGAKVVEKTINVDIRVKGLDKEGHFLNVTAEVMRILDNSLTYPFTGYDELVPDYSTQQDLSDSRIGVWRMLIPTKIVSYNTTR